MTTMSIIGTIHEDVTTDVLGTMGAWQWMVTLLSTALVIPTILNQHEDAFLLQPSQGYIMCVSHYEVVNKSMCAYTTSNGTEIECDNWQVRFMWLVWINRTWIIFCDKSKMKLLSTTVICRFGLVFGCIIFGIISDSFGRRISITISIVAELVLRLALTSCGSESWYLLLVFLKALFVGANHYLELVLVCEIASNSWRTTLSFIASSPRLLASICLIPIANSAPNHETYNFIAFLVSLIPLSIIRWIPESPQWLLYNRRIPLAEKTLSIAARKNCVKLCSDFKIRPVNHRAYTCLDEEGTCLNILSTHNVRVIVLSSLLIWSLYYFLWSPLYIQVYKPLDKYTPLQVLIVTLFMGCLNFYMRQKIKLRYLLTINIMILGTSTPIVIFLNRMQLNVAFFIKARKAIEPTAAYVANIIIELVSTMGLASGLISYALLLNITPRLFALKVRATLFGCCYAAGQLGAITCFLISSLAVHEVTAMIITLVITFIVIALCFILPDVDGRELPDTIQDMDYFSELSKRLRWATQKTTSPSYEEVEMRVYSFSSSGNNVTNNGSEERVPAQPVALIRLWYHVILCCRRCGRKKISFFK